MESLTPFSRWAPPNQAGTLDTALRLYESGALTPRALGAYVSSVGESEVRALLEDQANRERIVRLVAAVPFIGVVFVIYEGIQAIWQVVREAFPALGECWDALVAWVEDTANAVVSWAEGAWDTIAETLSSWWETVVEWFSGWFGEAERLVGEATGEAAAAWARAGEVLTDVVDGLGNHMPPSAFASREEYEQARADAMRQQDRAEEAGAMAEDPHRQEEAAAGEADWEGEDYWGDEWGDWSYEDDLSWDEAMAEWDREWSAWDDSQADADHWADPWSDF